MGITIGSGNRTDVLAADAALAAAAEARRRAVEAAERAAELARQQAAEARRQAELAKRQAEAARKAADAAAAELKSKAHCHGKDEADKVAQLQAQQRTARENALQKEAQAVLKEKQQGLQASKLKDVQQGLPPAAPSAATRKAQAEVEHAKSTADFYAKPFIGPQASPPPPPPAATDLKAQAKQVQAVYDQSGPVAAAEQLALAQSAPGLTRQQRAELLTLCTPVADKLAQAAGSNARDNHLPVDAKDSGKPSTSIQDTTDYRTLVDDLDTVMVQAGDDRQAQRLTQVVLDHVAPVALPGGVDKLGLLGSALQALPVDGPNLRSHVLAALQSDPPAGAPRTGVMAEPRALRMETAAALSEVPAADGLPIASPAERAAMAKYSDDRVSLAHDLLVDARKKEDALGKLEPGTDDYNTAAQAYRHAADLAMRERAKSEEAVAAELRQVYRGQPQNTAATVDQAHTIAARYRTDPEMQLSVKHALQAVKSETTQQSDTATKLYEFHRAADKVTDLQAQYNATGKTGEAGYKAALADYERTRSAAVSTMGNELQLARAGIDGDEARGKATDDAAMAIIDRFVGDEDVVRMAAAARIIGHAEDADGTTARMLSLGRAMPADTSLQIREIVMADPGVKSLVDKYVDDSARAVTDAYQHGVDTYQDKYGNTFDRHGYEAPATAATRKLAELTDPAKHPEVSPEVTARIVNKLYDKEGNGTLDKVIADVTMKGNHSAELMAIEGMPPDMKSFRGMPSEELWGYGSMIDRDEIVGDLSRVIDRAAAGSLPTGDDSDGKPTMAWESDQVRQAVEQTGQAFSINMAEVWSTPRDAINQSFRTVIGNGAGVTLALETAHQERKMQTDYGMSLDNAQGPADIAKETLTSVSRGLGDFKADTRTLFEEVHKSMAAVEVTQMRYGKMMSTEQAALAMQNVLEKHPDLAKTVDDGKLKLDERGYQVMRDGEMVTFYDSEDRLAQQPGFSDVVLHRNTLLDDDEVKTTLMGSSPAALHAKAQAVHASLNWMRDAGTVPPAAIGPVPVNLFLQWGGDFTENMIENNSLKRMYGDGFARLGNHGPLAAASWGAVGVTQLWFTDYLYHNVGFDAGQEWRKPVLLSLVGGFGAFKAYQAAAVLAHKALPDIEGLEKATDFTRVARWKSIGFFGLLHADAAVWDASRVVSEVRHWKDGKPVDQRNFWTATVNLSNDVAISTVEFKAAWGLLKDPLLSPLEARRIMAASGGGADGVLGVVSALTRDGPVKGTQLAIEGALDKYALSRFGLKAVMTPFNAYKAVGEVLAKKLPFMEAGPAGWVANIAWTTTDLVNWIGNEKKVHKQLEAVDHDFLTGAGLSSDAADTLSSRNLMKANFNRWLAGDSLSEGLLKAYDNAHGAPHKFLEWVDGLQKSGQLEKVRQATDYDTDKGAPANYEAFLLLPNDPSETDLTGTNIVYNEDKKRYEDPVTQTRYTSGGFWEYDHHIVAAPNAVKVNDPDQAHYFSAYSAKDRVVYFQGDVAVRLSANTDKGLENWLHVNGINVPPKPQPKPEPPPAAPVDTRATDRGNTHTVKPGESVWGIAGNDAKIVEWIYGHNLWLNDRMEGEHRPINTRGGQNPNYIDPGDVITLPDGYVVPKDAKAHG